MAEQGRIQNDEIKKKRGVWASRGPVKVLTDEPVSRLELVGTTFTQIHRFNIDQTVSALTNVLTFT